MYRCQVCFGSKKVRAGGNMGYLDCHSCATPAVAVPTLVTVDRRSKSYKDAINKIVEVNGVSREEAVRVFDEEFEKL